MSPFRTLLVSVVVQMAALPVVAQQSNTFQGAVPHGELSPQPLALSFEDAIARGLTYNLGLLLSSRTTDQARAQRLQELSQLLPQAGVSLRETRQTTSLQA